jgi:hypothetical protein
LRKSDSGSRATCGIRLVIGELAVTELTDLVARHTLDGANAALHRFTSTAQDGLDVALRLLERRDAAFGLKPDSC